MIYSSASNILQEEYINNVKFFLKHSDWEVTATPFDPPDKLIKLKDRHADVKWHMNLFGEFRRPFMGEGPRLMPANNEDFVGAHKVCGAPNSPTLYKNKLYKASFNFGSVGNGMCRA